MLPVNLQKHRKQITQIARRYGARDSAFLALTPAGDATTTSDLASARRPRSWHKSLRPGGMLYEIGQTLGIPVDILNEDSLDPEFRDRIKKDGGIRYER